MTRPSISDLKTTWSQRDDSTNSVSRAGIDLLADGRPVPAVRLAEAIGVSLDQAANYIERAYRAGAEVEDGAVVGAALTLRPTVHRFLVDHPDVAIVDLDDAREVARAYVQEA
ncbi:MAG: hypothetical protein GEU93_12890 [Propionibacteriales bacterium]|nr:hypothetical protein [Propionibacteriales bacterium]